MRLTNDKRDGWMPDDVCLTTIALLTQLSTANIRDVAVRSRRSSVDVIAEAAFKPSKRTLCKRILPSVVAEADFNCYANNFQNFALLEVTRMFFCIKVSRVKNPQQFYTNFPFVLLRLAVWG